MAYSKSTELALKAKKVYSSIDSTWHCYYHHLSGDDFIADSKWFDPSDNTFKEFPPPPLPPVVEPTPSTP
jgi:hypothetical protein